MNRSILIVICDFLLVSLLAFSTVDINKVSQNGTPRGMQLNAPPTNQVTGRQDLGDVMRLALDEERKNRDQLLGELTRTRAVVSQQEQQIKNAQGELQTKEQLAAQMAEARAKLEQEQANLQKQVATAQTNLSSLTEQLHATTVESVISKEQRAAMEAEARRQAEKAAALEQQLAQLQKNRDSMQADQQALQNQLQLSASSNRTAAVQLAQLQDEIESQRRENTRLTEGVKVLAAKSSELAGEIRDHRPLTPNVIFDELTTNRILATFTGVKPGLFGDSAKDKQTQIVLVTDGTNNYAVCHVQDTPLTLWSPGTQWEELRGTMAHGPGPDVPIQSLSFSYADPRIVFIPVGPAQAAALACKVYRLAKDPYTFQDAVVVGTREDYYGECKFQIDTSTPQYLKMDRSSIKGLFGKFNPSSGDLVMSKSGEVLGVMANNNYCAVLHNFEPVATFRFGASGRNQPTAQTLSTLYSLVTELPFKLQ